MTQLKTKLRVCASCEWIFDGEKHSGCPMCGFASYGARFVYGDKAYKYKYTQEPYKNRILKRLGYMLDIRISKHTDFEKPDTRLYLHIFDECEDR